MGVPHRLSPLVRIAAGERCEHARLGARVVFTQPDRVDRRPSGDEQCDDLIIGFALRGVPTAAFPPSMDGPAKRSEERRVGKECRL